MDYTPFRKRERNAVLSRTETSPWKEQAHSRITSTKDSVILKKKSRDRGKRGRGSDDSDENHLHESDPKKNSMGVMWVSVGATSKSRIEERVLY
ncbi:unnamed protein product [Allacma fusca]|uniref:Uncharacterized protein n=1 Tax=Allacma fusca TaxID=39272 RepID=A0A8J2M350_9HEXA|nr:unnamed protein product [Allacma fusca]